MTRTIVALAALLGAAGIANAQTTSPSTTSPGTHSPTTTATPPSSSTTMPSGTSGSTSGMMTSSEVKKKIEADGYKNVTGIKKDSMGNWTAQATKGSKQVAVMVDSKGDVKEAQQ